MGKPFTKDLLVDISDNLSNGASAAAGVGGYSDEAFVPVGILCPADLQAAARVKVQTAYVRTPRALVDTDFKDIYVDGAIVPLVLTLSVLLVVPEALASACLGASHIRLVTLNESNVAIDPVADITFTVIFTPAELMPGHSSKGAASAASSASSGAADSETSTDLTKEVGFWIRAMYAGMILKRTAVDVTDGLVFSEL